MSIVQSSRGKDKLLLNGFAYRRANDSQVIWRCSQNFCAGRVKFENNDYTTITKHVHPPNPDENISTLFKSEISTKAILSHDPPRRIIHETLLNTDQADSAAIPTYYSSQRTIQRKRIIKYELMEEKLQQFVSVYYLTPIDVYLKRAGALFNF